MLKRLYLRALEWALVPVLEPVTEKNTPHQPQAFAVNGGVAVLNHAMVGEASIKYCQIAVD